MLRKEVIEFLQTLPGVLSWISMGELYPSWGKEFSWDETLRVLAKVREMLVTIPFAELNAVELKALGFRLWDSTQTPTEAVGPQGLFLVPAYIFKALPSGMVLTGIDGEQVTVGKDEIDLDTRMGLLAYGIVLKNA